MKVWRLALVAVVAPVGAIGGPSVAAAEPRSFTQTYEYPTLPEGESEVALWHRQAYDASPASGPLDFEAVEDQLQLGYGITDHLEAALFTVFTQDSNHAFGFAALRGELHARLADRGVWPVDLVLHFAAAKQFDTRVDDLEARLVVARDFDRLTVAGDAVVTLHVGHEARDPKHTYGWAAGATYEVTPRFHAGIETWGTRADRSPTTFELGPALAFQASPRLWIAVTGGLGITAAANDFDGRLIAGFAR